jgi:hypothetical protein
MAKIASGQQKNSKTSHKRNVIILLPLLDSLEISVLISYQISKVFKAKNDEAIFLLMSGFNC